MRGSMASRASRAERMAAGGARPAPGGETGCPYHVPCVYKGKRGAHPQAKARGVDVTCETAPHYLLLCDTELEDDGRFKMNPPIRSAADRDALLEGLLDGTIDILATDHAPHSAEEKARGLEKSLMGVVGLECAFPAPLHRPGADRACAAGNDAARHDGHAACALSGCPPARIEPGAGDFAIFDLDKTFTIDPDGFLSKATCHALCGLAGTGEVHQNLCGRELRMAQAIKRRMLVMENGSVHEGTGFGSMNDAVCELVFNTSMVGYQEIVTDPSYTAQTVVMTYPLIGNYGITDEDNETRVPTMGGLVVREYCDMPSNFRYTKTLGEILEENGIPGLQGRGHAAHRPDDPQRGQPARADLRRGYPCRGGAGTCSRLPPAHRQRQPRQLQEEVVRPHAQSALQRGGGRLRHQAQHRAKAQPVRLQRDRGALRHPLPTPSQLQPPTGCSSPTAPEIPEDVRPVIDLVRGCAGGCPSSASAWGIR